MTSPVLQTVTYVDNHTIVLHFDRAVVAGDGGIEISDGYLQSYYGSAGRTQRLVGATDVRSLISGDDQITYGQDVTIHLDTALKSGLNYSIIMNSGAVEGSDGGGFNASVGPGQFSVTVSGVVSTPATPSAMVDATIHFTDTGSGANASDYITSSQSQEVSGTYTGTLGTNDFIQVSLDNGASWHKATVNSDTKTWSFGGEINLDNLTADASGDYSSAMLVRVGNVAGGSSAIASQEYTYSNHPITVDISSNFTFSADTGANNSDLITNTAQQTISGFYEGTLASGQKLQVSVDGGTTWVDASTGNGSWSSNTKLTLQSGTHEVQARVIDAEGNTGAEVSHNYKLITSTVALGGHGLTLLSDFDTGVSHSDGITKSPASVMLNVADLHGFRAGDTIEIVDTSNGSAVVGSYVIQASDLYYGNDYFSEGQYNPDARTEVSISLNSLSNGDHTLAARVLDVAGNTSATNSSSLSLTIDNIAPTLLSSSPEEDAGSIDTGIPTLTFTFDENIVVAEGTQITITDDENQYNTQTVTLSAGAVNGKVLTITLEQALTAGTHYTVQGADVGDLAGNSGITGDNPMLHFTTAGTYAGGGGGSGGPEAPMLDYTDTAPAWDTDPDSTRHTDGITSNNGISVNGISADAEWYYRINGGSWELGGRGNGTLTLEDGSYAEGSIEVKQVFDGVDSGISTIHTALEVITARPDASVVGTTGFESGDNLLEGLVLDSVDFSNEFVELTFDHGETWVKAAVTGLDDGLSSWSKSGISDVLGDSYGVRVSDGAGNSHGLKGQPLSSAIYYLADSGVTYSHENDNYGIVFGGEGADTITLGNHAIVLGGDNDTVTTGDNSTVTVGAHGTVTTGNGVNFVFADAYANITTGSGEDYIALTSLSNVTLHADAGNDTLVLEEDMAFSLSSLSNFTGVDIINFDSEGTNQLTILNSSYVHSLTDSDKLTIKNSGHGDTTITLDSLLWGTASDVVSGYDVYRSGQGSGSIVILIAQGENITVHLSALSG